MKQNPVKVGRGKLLKSFMACVEDNLREREAEEFGKGLNIRIFGWKREFLHGHSLV